MDERTRHQLTGALFWFGLLIVLVGHWYNHPVNFQPGGEASDKTAAKPIVDKPLVVELPAAPPVRTLKPAQTDAPDRPPPRPASPAADRAAKKSQPAGQAPRWIVKVAAYFTARQANELVAALNEAGYDATYRKFRNRKGQTVYSVRVGPYASRAAAERAKRIIDRRWRANSLIEKANTEH